jgi:hypothetical protein
VYGYPGFEAPAWRMRPILRPGTPPLVGILLAYRPSGVSIVWSLLLALLGAGSLLAGILLLMVNAAAGQVLGATLSALPFAAVGVGWWRYHDDVVAPPGWRYRGVPIHGESLGMLEDIQGRFDYAHRLVDEVPSGLDWREIQGSVAELLWEAVGHAARVSALDAEGDELRYAAAGTPQAALRGALEERRSEHWRFLEDVQAGADGLARDAGNAAAAAKVALARTGSIHALEIVAPTARGILARDAIREARARLVMLADVWAELDETATLLAERVRHEAGDGADVDGRRRQRE